MSRENNQDNIFTSEDTLSSSQSIVPLPNGSDLFAGFQRAPSLPEIFLEKLRRANLDPAQSMTIIALLKEITDRVGSTLTYVPQLAEDTEKKEGDAIALELSNLEKILTSLADNQTEFKDNILQQVFEDPKMKTHRRESSIGFIPNNTSSKTEKITDEAIFLSDIPGVITALANQINNAIGMSQMDVPTPDSLHSAYELLYDAISKMEETLVYIQQRQDPFTVMTEVLDRVFKNTTAMVVLTEVTGDDKIVLFANPMAMKFMTHKTALAYQAWQSGQLDSLIPKDFQGDARKTELEAKIRALENWERSNRNFMGLSSEDILVLMDSHVNARDFSEKASQISADGIDIQRKKEMIAPTPEAGYKGLVHLKSTIIRALQQEGSKDSKTSYLLSIIENVTNQVRGEDAALLERSVRQQMKVNSIIGNDIASILGYLDMMLMKTKRIYELLTAAYEKIDDSRKKFLPEDVVKYVKQEKDVLQSLESTFSSFVTFANGKYENWLQHLGMTYESQFNEPVRSRYDLNSGHVFSETTNARLFDEILNEIEKYRSGKYSLFNIHAKKEELMKVEPRLSPAIKIKPNVAEVLDEIQVSKREIDGAIDNVMTTLEEDVIEIKALLERRIELIKRIMRPEDTQVDVEHLFQNNQECRTRIDQSMTGLFQGGLQVSVEKVKKYLEKDKDTIKYCEYDYVQKDRDELCDILEMTKTLTTEIGEYATILEFLTETINLHLEKMKTYTMGLPIQPKELSLNAFIQKTEKDIRNLAREYTTRLEREQEKQIITENKRTRTKTKEKGNDKIVSMKAIEEALIDFQSSIPEDAVIFLDQSHMSIVIREVVLNALDALYDSKENIIGKRIQIVMDICTEERTVIGEKEKAVQKNEKLLRIKVLDNGPGFIQVPKEFKAFESKSMNHIGIGLSFAENIVHQHQGNLEINSPLKEDDEASLTFKTEVIMKLPFTFDYKAPPKKQLY